MKRNIAIIIIGLLLFVLPSSYYFLEKRKPKIGSQLIITDTEKEVLSYLKSKNYEVIEFNDKSYYQYILTEEMLKDESKSAIWSNIKNPKEYLGKNIEEHYAVVSNHPLQKKYPDKRILLKILKVEDQIIGGFAIVEPEYGTIYNLDGSKIISK